MRDRTDGAPYDLMPGLFDDALTWPLHSEIYVDQAMSAMTIAGDHRRATADQYRVKNPQTEGVGNE
jgi:hypothetical protein